MEEFLFDGWRPLGRTAVVGLLAYALLVVLLRLSGKRTLAKMNAFDLVVTVALGSTLATILLSRDVTLAQGGLALLLLVLLQLAITWTGTRVAGVRRLVTGEPTVLLLRGELLRQPMRRTRVNDEDVRAAVRAAGLARLDDALAVVLETDGTFSVIRESGNGAGLDLTGVELPGERTRE